MNEDIKEELIEMETVQVAIYDKLHKMQEYFVKMEALLESTQKRMDKVRESLSG